MTEKPASAASFPEESRDPLSLWNTTNSWNTLDSSWNEENVSTTRWPFLIPSQNASAYIPAGWTEPIRDSGTDAEFNLDDVNIALNQSLKNVTGNETYYDYDYEAALETFFWRQLAPPLVVYGVTYVVGVVGNSLIIFTICRYRRLKTTTNVFLASLASADLLLILICIPVKLARLFSYSWTLGELLCKMLYFLQALSAICSVLTLTTMSIERYYAIVYPMRAQYRCTISQARRLCAAIWLCSLVLACPVLLLQVHMEVGVRVRAYWCVRDFDSPLLWRSYETYMLVLVLLVPAGVMAAAYAAISNAIIHMMVQRRSITGKGQMANGVLLLNGSSRGRRRESEESEVRQVISMLVVVVVLFVVCWGPILVVNVLKAYGVIPAYSLTLKHVVTAADLLSYCNSCVNPVVYGFMSRNFRESFWQVLCCRRYSYQPSVSRQMSLSVTRTSILRYNADTSVGRSAAPDGPVLIKTTPS
ncbi:QRFP-like peptide receptor isoform X2 [Cherax quadricarinatus]|uniref:QRFP-like peptide receptor isoform X2 n=1 Tax=Cherax quadricarinatus TaxID=27406 RepID=UPI00387E77CE